MAVLRLRYEEEVHETFPNDLFLRNHGWKVFSRLNGMPAVWVHLGGQVMEERDAIAHIVKSLRKYKGMQCYHGETESD